MVDPAITDHAVISWHPATLYQKLAAFFTDDASWLTWDAETLFLQLSQVTAPVATDKVMAVKACAQNMNVPCTSALAFEKTAMAFCNNVCVMDSYQPLHTEEAVYTVHQLQAIAKTSQDSEIEFSGEVPSYVAAVAKHRQTPVLPKSLEFAQDLAMYLTGYTPTADECRAIDGVHALATSDIDKLRDPDALDQLPAMQQSGPGLVTFLVGCYLFSPAEVDAPWTL
jgi:hypothetical protein